MGEGHGANDPEPLSQMHGAGHSNDLPHATASTTAPLLLWCTRIVACPSRRRYSAFPYISSLCHALDRGHHSAHSPVLPACAVHVDCDTLPPPLSIVPCGVDHWLSLLSFPLSFVALFLPLVMCWAGSPSSSRVELRSVEAALTVSSCSAGEEKASWGHLGVGE